MRIISLITLFALMFVGCGTEICYDTHPHSAKLQILTDWNGTVDVPKGIVVYFYPESSTSVNREPIIEYLSNVGGEVYFPFGPHKAFAYNDYAENVLLRGMDKYSTAEVYLDQYNKAPFSTRSPDTKYVSEPDLFYIAQIEEISLDTNNPSQEILIYPRLVTIDLEFTIDIDGLKNVAQARGSLSGVAKSISLSTGKGNLNDVANVVFDFNINDKNITTKIRSFGLLYDESSKNTLELAFMLKDGTEDPNKYVYDITKTVSDAIRENGGKIPTDGIKIKIEDVEIPDEGMDMGVEDWEDEEINLYI